jgi:hypothetical protein
MSMRNLTISCVLLVCVGRASGQAAPEQPASEQSAAAPSAALITHVPLNEVFTGAVSIAFELRDPQLAGAITVHVSSAASTKETQVIALRSGRDYEAAIPAAYVVPPGFSYYVTERMPDGSERPVFASREAPHPVRVARPQEEENEREQLKLRGGQRSMLLMLAEAVDYGDRRLAGADNELHDRYYRLEIGYAYSFLTRVQAIRLSLVRVRGEAALLSPGLSAASPTNPGIDYGRAEITMQVNDWIRMRSALLLGASQFGFEYGGGGALTLGDPRDCDLDVGFEHMTTLGTSGWLRLGFSVHERVPMGASVEVSSFPLGDEAGVRLLYDVGYRFGPVTQLSVRGGYQGRTSVSGGASLGAAFDYGF